jgi:hypothetical protein
VANALTTRMTGRGMSGHWPRMTADALAALKHLWQPGDKSAATVFTVLSRADKSTSSSLSGTTG